MLSDHGDLAEDNSPGVPMVTVIMPIRNEAAYLLESLEAVLCQEYPADRLEILVADGMSSDATREIVRKVASAHPGCEVRVVDNTSGIVSTGLNTALSFARGEVIVRVDGHTTIASDYVRECVRALSRSGVECVGGRMNAVGRTWFGKAVALATSSPFGVGGARFHYSLREELVDTVYLGAWPREVFDRVGVFDTEQVRNQDDEFSYRLRSRGGRILLCPQIKSTYCCRGTFVGLWRQYFGYGYWKARVMQKHPSQMRPRHFVPLVFVISLFSLALLAVCSELGAFALAGLVGIYLSANLAASAVSTCPRNWRVLLAVPVAFATLHLAYGLGALAGFVKSWRSWNN